MLANAMWDCSPNSQKVQFPVAVCNRVAFAGVSLSIPDVFGSEPPNQFSAEQRIKNGQLYTRSVAKDGAIFETLSLMHPSKNTVVTNVTFTTGVFAASAVSPVLNVSLWVGDGGEVIRQSCGSSGCINTATRTAGPINSTTVRYVTSSLAVFTPTSLALESGRTITIVSAVADNLLAWPSTSDPTPDATAMASNPSAAVDTAAASASYWSTFWSKSAVNFPSQPELEAYWFGAQYVMAGMSATDELSRQFRGLIPPSGLYGPWVTSDHPSWNGDYTLDCKLCVVCVCVCVCACV